MFLFVEINMLAIAMKVFFKKKIHTDAYFVIICELNFLNST